MTDNPDEKDGTTTDSESSGEVMEERSALGNLRRPTTKPLFDPFQALSIDRRFSGQGMEDF